MIEIRFMLDSQLGTCQITFIHYKIYDHLTNKRINDDASNNQIYHLGLLDVKYNTGFSTSAPDT
ncbi:hypothetical protein DERF_006883 [Dermatophagoides farinae]|uniref:Uncharacterized protein n=1 Tax=Dermatophagoides farinae TaxID=6954 RepID=A0A922I131_DERFA|nr:hypothetical protein DERF_006883 [Dermatophagoides farinae]